MYDFVRYEGEWHNNKKHGYGITTFRDGTKEEGKYKCNLLITSQKKKHLFLIRSAKFRERIEASVSSAQRASKYALQKADIAVSRQSTARGKAEMADNIADHAKIDSEVAVATAKEFAPDFKPSVLERFERVRLRERFKAPVDTEQPVKPNVLNFQENRTNLNSGVSYTNPNQMFGQPSRTSQLQRQNSIDYPNKITNQNKESNPFSTSDLYQKTQQPHSTYYQYSQQQPPGANYAISQAILNNNQVATEQAYKNGQRNYSNNSQPITYGQQQQQQHHMPQSNTQEQFNQQQQKHDFRSVLSDNQSQYHKNQHPPLSNLSNINYYNNSGDETAFLTKSSEFDVSQQQQVDLLLKPNFQKNSNVFLDETKASTNYSQSSIDHFDHYKRPPSRDSSVDRYAKATNRMAGNSRQPSLDRTGNTIPIVTNDTPERSSRSGSAFIGTQNTTLGNGNVSTGIGGSRSVTPAFQHLNAQAVYSSPNQPFEDVLLRQRSLGQDIIPSPREPKRTESLYLPPKPIVAQSSEKPKLKVSVQ